MKSLIILVLASLLGFIPRVSAVAPSPPELFGPGTASDTGATSASSATVYGFTVALSVVLNAQIEIRDLTSNSVAYTSEFTTFSNFGNCSFAVPFSSLTQGHKFSWRARSRDNGGSAGAWSQPFFFSIPAAVPVGTPYMEATFPSSVSNGTLSLALKIFAKGNAIAANFLNVTLTFADGSIRTDSSVYVPQLSSNSGEYDFTYSYSFGASSPSGLVAVEIKFPNLAAVRGSFNNVGAAAGPITITDIGPKNSHGYITGANVVQQLTITGRNFPANPVVRFYSPKLTPRRPEHLLSAPVAVISSSSTSIVAELTTTTISNPLWTVDVGSSGGERSAAFGFTVSGYGVELGRLLLNGVAIPIYSNGGAGDGPGAIGDSNFDERLKEDAPDGVWTSRGEYNWIGPVPKAYTTGLKWQCTEFAVRTYFFAYGTDIYAKLNADQWYPAAKNGISPLDQLACYDNGLTTVLPQVGDILCFDGTLPATDAGHVGIVKDLMFNSSTSFTVRLAQQHVTNVGGPGVTDGDDNFPIAGTIDSRGLVTIKPERLGPYLCQGWLRLKPAAGLGGGQGASSTVGAAFTAAPSAAIAEAGKNITLASSAVGSGTVSYQWYRNGAAIPGATAPGWQIGNLQPSLAGVYSVVVANSYGASFSDPVVVGVSSAVKVLGSGEEVAHGVYVASNGNTFDQVLLKGSGATITAERGKVTRLSFVDLTASIVQVEFSGSGALTLVLDNASGPATASHYNQPGVAYMRGHAGIIIVGADATTNLSVFSVGRKTAVNQALFRSDVVDDGIADLAYVAILSPTGEFGGLRLADSNFFASAGITGVLAPGITFHGPVWVGDISASDRATPVLKIGSTADARITGGDLFQPNGLAVQVAGLARLRFTDGQDSNGNQLTAQQNRAVLETTGVNVTSEVVW